MPLSQSQSESILPSNTKAWRSKMWRTVFATLTEELHTCSSFVLDIEVYQNADLRNFVWTHGSCVRRVINCILY